MNESKGKEVWKRAANKYKAVLTQLDGITFHSRKEAWRYADLLLLQKAGQIRDLERQPRFVIAAGFSRNGLKYREKVYVADFRYFDETKKRVVVEDVKGYRTQLYSLKRHLFLSNLGKDVEFIET